MANDHIVRVINVALFFSYSEGSTAFAPLISVPLLSAFSLFGLGGSDTVSLELEEFCRALALPFPLPRCWNLTDLGFVILIEVVTCRNDNSRNSRRMIEIGGDDLTRAVGCMPGVVQLARSWFHVKMEPYLTQSKAERRRRYETASIDRM